MSNVCPVKLVAIVGGSGAGKGWLVSRLCEVLGDNANHLQLDNFYRDRSHMDPQRRARLNFDVPHAIDWDGAIRALCDCRAGTATRVPRYDFATYCRVTQDETWSPRPLVLVDGLWLLRSADVRRLFDLSLFLDVPEAVRHARRLARDVSERGYDATEVEHRLRTAVAPMHDRYVEPQKKWADVILEQPFQEADLLRLADRLWGLLLESELMPVTSHDEFRERLVSVLLDHEYRC
jgi:uridine kinase